MDAIPSFKLRLPKLTTRKVWVGCYSEMTGTVVLLFGKKPRKCPFLDHYGPTSPDYVGSIWIAEWERWFGTVQPLEDAGIVEDRGELGWVATSADLQCRKVIRIALTMPWTEDGFPAGLDVSADN